MNAVIALCHFCELHGPSVVFCTQAYHGNGPEDILESTKSLEENSGDEEEKEFYGNIIEFLRTNSTGDGSDSSSRLSDTCEACRSVHPGYISSDHKSKVSYLSSQFPCHPGVFSAVRQACLQSLSCEVCVGREGPIFFGDKERGHVFSYTFFLRDSQARGLQRWFSIIVLMTDKMFLLSSWPFLVQHIRPIIDELQTKANQTVKSDVLSKLYDTEQSECPQRALRLSSVTSVTPGDFRRQRGGNKSMRGLADLTRDPDVFAKIHSSFTWILIAGVNRLVERTLEGNVTEDTVIDMEQQTETEEGFTMITTKKVPVQYQKQKSVVEEQLSDTGQWSGLNIRNIHQSISGDDFRLLAYQVVTGDQIIVISEDRALVGAIINALKILIPRGCAKSLYSSIVYQDAYLCNFLGLSPNVKLPAHIVSSQLYLQLMAEPSSDENDGDFPKIKMSVVTSKQLPDKLPAVLLNMERAIENEKISNTILAHYFVSLKEEWMNKVKVVFKFSRSGSRSQEDTQNLLHVLGSQESDKQLLKFWMTGLSSQYKAYVLSAPMSQCLGNEGAAS